METETITTLVTIGTSMLVTGVVFILYSNMKKGRYDSERNMAMLDSIRASFEKQIYMLNDKLVKSEERWRDVNHLLIRNEKFETDFETDAHRKPELNSFLKSNGITQSDLKIEKRLVFVLTPFHPKFRDDYLVIKNTCQDVGLNCIRGDESFMGGDIFPEMLKLILKADLIIANINGRNSNVLYELGIAQALDKPVILISRQPEMLPIDVKSKRFLIYENFEELNSQLKNELIKVLSR